MGGRAVYFGKPHESAFEAALEAARAFGPCLRPLIVGDGLETDILGANRIGWDALLILSGLFGPADESAQSVQALLEKFGVHVRAVMRGLSW
jgi:ribonucleotide monophosphatase NagD (HAD superfamily)